MRSRNLEPTEEESALARKVIESRRKYLGVHPEEIRELRKRGGEFKIVTIPLYERTYIVFLSKKKGEPILFVSGSYHSKREAQEDLDLINSL